MIKILFKYGDQLKQIQKSIDQFRRLKTYDQASFELLLSNLKTPILNSKIVTLGEKIEKVVFYYLDPIKQEAISNLLCESYAQNMRILSEAQLIRVLKARPDWWEPIFEAFTSKLEFEQIQFSSFIDCCISLGIFSKLSVDQWAKLLVIAEKLLSEDDLELALILSLCKTDLKVNLKYALQTQKIKNSMSSLTITLGTLTKLKSILKDQCMSFASWNLLKDQCLQIFDQSDLALKQFIYNHFKRYYCLANYPYGVGKHVQATWAQNITTSLDWRETIPAQHQAMVKLLLEVSRNNQKQLEIEFSTSFAGLEEFSLYEFIFLNSELKKTMNINYYNYELMFSYFEVVSKELKLFLSATTHGLTENLQILVNLLRSIDGVNQLAESKKRKSPINVIYRDIAEFFFPKLVANSYEVDLDLTTDQFSQELLKIKKEQVGKWKEQSDQAFIKINPLPELKPSILQLSDLFNRNQQGTQAWHYVLIKQLVHETDSNPSPDILYHLARVDKLFLLPELGKIHASEPGDSIKLLYFSVVSLNLKFIQQLLSLPLIPQDDDQRASLHLIQRMLQLEFPSLKLKAESYQQAFEEYWLRVQDEQDVLCQDVKQYLDQHRYHYRYKEKVDVWQFLFVSETTVIFCIPKRGYLGNTNQLLVEVQILKRILRQLDLKMRILDHREYVKLETRREKNDYIEEKLRHLEKDPEPPKTLYYNY